MCKTTRYPMNSGSASVPCLCQTLWSANYGKYPQMKFAVVVLLAFFSFSAFAGARVVVSSLPEAATPDAEVCTNIALNVNAARLQTRLSSGSASLILHGIS